jgi:hypothetical protein
MSTFHILNEKKHQSISANALIVIYIEKEPSDFSNLKRVFDQINKSFYSSSDLLEDTQDFKATQNVDGEDIEFFHLKLKFKDGMHENEFDSVCDIIKSVLNIFSDVIFGASLEKREYNSFSFIKGNVINAPADAGERKSKSKDFKYEEKVMFKGKIYDFAYYSQTPGKAVIYKEGERNMQDSIAVSVKDLDRV